MPEARGDASAPVVRVVVDTRAIIAALPHERPPVQLDEWDTQAYARERLEAYREALQRPLAAVGARLETLVDTELAPAHELRGGDRITVTAPESAADGLQHLVRCAVAAIEADRSGWRRFLLPTWFERHRAWRREVGSPIAH